MSHLEPSGHLGRINGLIILLQGRPRGEGVKALFSSFHLPSRPRQPMCLPFPISCPTRKPTWLDCLQENEFIICLFLKNRLLFPNIFYASY